MAKICSVFFFLAKYMYTDTPILAGKEEAVPKVRQDHRTLLEI